MGSRGPIPLSEAVLTARGSTLAARRRKAEQGRRGVGKGDRLRCPDWLDDEARKCWHRVVEALRPYGVLRTSDSLALERYAHMQSMWVRLVEARNLLPDTDPNAIRVERRALKVSVALLTLEDRFGMNPAARLRMGLPQAAPPTPDPRLRFFGRAN